MADLGLEQELGFEPEDGCGATDDYEEGSEDAASVVSSAAAAAALARRIAPKVEGPRKKEDKKKCKVCVKNKILAEFALNSAACRECKQCIDNLERQATIQGESEYWRAIRSNDKDLRRIVLKYQQQCPRLKEKGKRGVFSMVAYKEEYAAETIKAVTSTGRFMWKGHFEKYYKEPEGGSHTPEEAAARWTMMKDDGEWERDEKGPSKAPLRLLIPFSDDVGTTSQLRHSKAQVLSNRKDDKNVTEEDARLARRSIYMAHEKGGLNRRGGEEDFAGLTKGLLANLQGLNPASCSSVAGGAAFAGDGPVVTNVRGLLRVEEPSGSEDEGDEGPPKKRKTGEATSTEKGAVSTVKDSDPKKKNVKRKWFDASAAVAKATTVVEQAGSAIKAGRLCFNLYFETLLKVYGLGLYARV